MQRLLSILLTLVLSLGPTLSAIPANALVGWSSSSDESHLPACCRKNGAHHCAASMQSAGSSGQATISAQICCPNWPGTVASTNASIAAVIHATNSALSTSAEHFSQHFSEQAQNRTTQHTHPKRGPPSETSI